MSNGGDEKIQLQDLPRSAQSVNLSTSALPLHNNPQGSHFGSASAAAVRGHAHPTEPSSSAAGKTFFQHLQHKLRGGGVDPRVRYRCNADRYRGPHMDSSPWVGRKHDCVNFESVSVFEEAKDYYQDAQRNATSVRAVNALALILLLVPLLPLTLLVLLFWTFRVGFALLRKENPKFAFPLYSLALDASIWIIFVPCTKLAGLGGFPALVLPSLSPGFQHVQAEVEEKGKELINKREAAHLKLKAQLARASREEEEALNSLAEITIDQAPKKWRSALNRWRGIEANRKFIENRLKEVEQEIREIRRVAETEACMRLTGYEGIADWAKDAWDAYDNLINAMTAVCGLGAGLSYGAVTSAQRGNVAYMSYSFAFFIIGLTLTTTAQALLTWCSRMHNYAFTTPYIWEIIIGVGVYGAVASVIVGILWLLISIQVLEYPMGTFPQTGDAPLVFNLPPQPAIYATYGLFGAAIFVAFMVFILFGSANGFKTLFWRRSEERKRVAKDAKRLLDYDPTHKPAVPSPDEVLHTTAFLIRALPMAVAGDPNPSH